MEKGLVIYDALEGEVVFDIDKEKETIWATIDQIAQLFGVTRRSIEIHLNKIYQEQELEEGRTAKENFAVRMEGNRQVRRKVRSYNLDAIISVGYRVNSAKATKFRIWATNVLKQYIVQGAAVNERRLRELPEEKLEKIEGALGLVRRLMAKSELEGEEAQGILEVVAKYGKTIETIKEFDEGEIQVKIGEGKRRTRNLSIGEMKNLMADFGEFREGEEEKLTRFLEELEKDEGSVAQKAAKLLYYICKEEPLTEGNRQSGAIAFVYYLAVNDFRLSEKGETKISDRELTAIVLLIAESQDEEKELMIGLVTKLLEN